MYSSQLIKHFIVKNRYKAGAERHGGKNFEDFTQRTQESVGKVFF
jgi:hypothetical protein